MNLQSVVNDVKHRVDVLAAQGQEAVKILPETLKSANDIVLSGWQELLKTKSATAKELLASARVGYEKAKLDGVVAVVSNPVGYLPPRDKLKTAFTETVELVSKTGDELYQELYKTVKTTLKATPGTMSAKADMAGEPAVVKKPRTVAKKSAPKKAAKKAV